MKAAYLERPGGAEVLIYGDIADPVPGPGQVLIRVRALSLNHVETIVRSGIRTYFKINPPHVLGNELAGEILEIGPETIGFSPGDRVLATPATGAYGGQGSYAELVVAKADQTVHLPEQLSFEDAAPLASTGPTAFRMVVHRAQVRPGEWVFVSAAASGTGIYMLQMAKIAGARVIATAGSGDKCRLVEQLGADATINHYNDDIAARISAITGGEGIDAAIDAVSSQPMFDAITSSLRPGGRLVTYGNMAGNEVVMNIRTLFSKGIEIRGGQGTEDARTAIEHQNNTKAVVALAASGQLRAVTGAVMPLSEAAAAHELLESHRVSGKIILLP